MKESHSPGKHDPRNAKHQRQLLPPQTDATYNDQPQAGHNKGPPFREQLCHKRLLTSLPRVDRVDDRNGVQVSTNGQNMSRLCITRGLYGDFAGVDDGSHLIHG